MGQSHLLVLSDVHLSQTHPLDPSEPLWMRYRRADRHPDAEYASLLDALLARYPNEPIEVAWNGDVLDFDAPWVKDGQSSFDEYPTTDAGCAGQVRRIVKDHPVWFGATAKLLARGHRVTILSGNHDIELAWPGARAALRDEMKRILAEQKTPLDDATLDQRLRFRAWFHVTESGVYLEHGSQYDVFNGVRYAMLPFTRDRAAIHPQMGKLAFKRTGARLGYLNPYYEETFYMGFGAHFAHFLKHYAFGKRHSFRVWLGGAWRTVREIAAQRHKEDWVAENRARAVAETGASEAAVDATFALTARPAEEQMLPIWRELWLDRFVILVAFLVLCGLSLLLGLIPGVIVTALLLLAIAAYEILTPKPDVRTYDSAPSEVRRLLEIHGAKALCMGHTHRPWGRWELDRFQGNSGSWSPAYRDLECTEPVLAKRPLILLSHDGKRLSGGLFWWNGKELEADRGR